jgi:hypothetical protein
VIKTILSEGSGWQHPNPQDEVVITYTARITDPPAPAAAGAASAAAAAADQDPSSPVVASSPEGGAVFVASEAPCSGLAAAVRSMKQQEAVRLLLKPECKCNRGALGSGFALLETVRDWPPHGPASHC